MYRVAKSRRTLATGLKSTIYTTSPPDLGSQYLRPVSVASPTKTQIQKVQLQADLNQSGEIQMADTIP